jgi:hypothetical protein
MRDTRHLFGTGKGFSKVASTIQVRLIKPVRVRRVVPNERKMEDSSRWGK